MNLEQKYKEKIKGDLIKEYGIKNKMAVPGLEKIVVNSGIGDAAKDKKILASIAQDMATITGQKPLVLPAKISVASFSVRKGMPVGMKVTLRGKRMYIFLEKLIKIVLPRLRDFRGVSKKSIDEGGNYTLGIRDHTVFPEIDSGKISNPHGLEVTLVTNTKVKEQSLKLLELMGMPFEKDEDKK